MWIVCITSVRHVLTVNGYGGRQTKENEKSWCFKGWETLVTHYFNRHPFLFLITKERSLFGIMNFHTTQKMFYFSGLQTKLRISTKTLTTSILH